MATAIEGLARQVASQVGLHSPLGRWILRVSAKLAILSGDSVATSGGCCIPDVIFGNVGSPSEFIPFPAGCEQPDTNYVVTGVFRGGDLSGGVEWAISAKDPSGFTVSFSGGVPVGGLLMDFLVTRC